MSLLTVTITGSRSQHHYWTLIDDRPNSNAGTEGLIRALHEYRDMFGPNELVAPKAVIHFDPQPEHGRDWPGHQGGGHGHGPGGHQPPPSEVSEPSAVALLLLGMLCLVIWSRFRQFNLTRGTR